MNRKIFGQIVSSRADGTRKDVHDFVVLEQLPADEAVTMDRDFGVHGRRVFSSGRQVPTSI